MKNRKQQAPLTNIGASSLLVVFVVLCLLTFSVLSLMTASRDLGFSKQLAERRTDYYAAGNQAAEIEARVDVLLQEAYVQDSDQYQDVAMDLIETEEWGEIPVSVTEQDGTYTVAYSVPVDQRQKLQVELTVEDAQPGETLYNVSKWETEMSVEYNEEQLMNLMQFGD